MDGLTRAEFDHTARDLHLLALVAGEVHLDAVALGIIEGMVTETGQIEVSVELPIDSRKQVEVEPGRNAAGIVIGRVEDTRVLHQVDPDEQDRAPAQDASAMAEEGTGFMRLEITNGGAGEKPGVRQVGHFGGQGEWLSNVSLYGDDGKLRRVAAKGLRLLHQHFGRDVDGYISGDGWRSLNQNARLLARAATELDHGRTIGNQARNLSGVIMQDRQLATGQVIFRGRGDGVEKLRAGFIIKVFGRYSLGPRSQSGDDLAR